MDPDQPPHNRAAAQRRARLGTSLAALCLTLACPINATADPGPPTVTLTSPAESSAVFGGIQVTADAGDDTGIAGVQFFLDGAPLGDEDLTAPYALAWNSASAGNGAHTLSAQARDLDGLIAASAAVAITVINDGSPEQIGRWGPLMTWPVVAIHLSLLPTGEVVAWDSHEQDALPLLWNPQTEQFFEVPNDSGLFCAGHTVMADGRMLAAGGHPYDDEDHEGEHGIEFGIRDANAFEAATRTWTRLASMRFPRWYPTLVPTADGRVVAISGQIDPANWADTPELYDPSTDTWRALPWANTRNMRTTLYLRAETLPDGRVFVTNPEDGRLQLLDLALRQWRPIGAIAHSFSSVAMYRPGKVLASGGTDDASAPAALPSATVIDATASTPVWRQTTPMNAGRVQHNLLSLPDGRVLAVGGSDVTPPQSTTGVLAAESWDPASEAWTTLAEMSDLRLYHSAALLLPDGRVLAAGGGRAGAAVSLFTAQLYSPPYLFRGPRPVITDAPSTWEYGGTALVETPDALDVARVALISLNANTHATSMGQRYVELPFTSEPGLVRVSVPSDPRLLTPGSHMLFLVSGSGVPSVASMIRLDANPSPLPVEAFLESAGQVVIEAEHYDAKIPRNGRDWPVQIATPGFSRSAYLQALPNSGAVINTGYVATSPELVFNVLFKKPGTYHAWVRGAAAGGGDDSCHLGLDGSGPASARRLQGFVSGWSWRRSTPDAPATLSIKTAGLHTIHLWMREDGLKLDKLLLRTSTSSTPPSGTGPAESPRVSWAPTAGLSATRANR